MKHVVITGMGVVSPLGGNVGEQTAALDAGRHGIRRMPEWALYKGLRSLIAAPAELKNEKAIPRQNRRSMGRMSIYSALAAEKALHSSGLTRDFTASGRCACIIGSTMGSGESIMDACRIVILNDSENMPALQFFKCASHSAAFNTANFLGLTGCVLAPAAACASGNQT